MVPWSHGRAQMLVTRPPEEGFGALAHLQWLLAWLLLRTRIVWGFPGTSESLKLFKGPGINLYYYITILLVYNIVYYYICHGINIYIYTYIYIYIYIFNWSNYINHITKPERKSTLQRHSAGCPWSLRWTWSKRGNECHVSGVQNPWWLMIRWGIIRPDILGIRCFFWGFIAFFVSTFFRCFIDFIINMIIFLPLYIHIYRYIHHIYLYIYIYIYSFFQNHVFSFDADIWIHCNDLRLGHICARAHWVLRRSALNYPMVGPHRNR